MVNGNNNGNAKLKVQKFIQMAVKDLKKPIKARSILKKSTQATFVVGNGKKIQKPITVKFFKF